MASSKILVVEDDPTLLSVLEYNLSREGHTVATAADGAAALETARRQRPELIILDIMLPKLSGLEVSRILRREMTVPILMLTAKDEEIDKVLGLELGADDYVTKPFSMRELLARIRALLRRSQMAEQRREGEETVYRTGDLEVDVGRRTASRDGTALHLTPKEFDLLAFLSRNKGFAFNRQQILEKVWGYDFAGDTRTVDVHVRWLRAKIEADPARPRRLVTVRGVGYKIED